MRSQHSSHRGAKEGGAEDPDPKSVEVLSRFLTQDVNAASVIHFGCGNGIVLSALLRRGIQGIGVARRIDDYETVVEDVRPDWQFRDLRLPVFVGRADLALCLGDCECVDSEQADTLADMLVRAAIRYVIFTDRQNPPSPEEEPSAFWRQKFENRSFGVDDDLTARLRDLLVEASALTGTMQTPPVVFARNL